MKRQFRNFTVAVATIAVTTFSTVAAEACGGRGGGGGGGYSFGGGFARTVSQARPFQGYSQPTYSQPVYSQPAYAQPTYSQPTYSQPTRHPQPVTQQPVLRRSVQRRSVSPAIVRNQTPNTAPVSQAPESQTPSATPQRSVAKAPVTKATTPSPSANTQPSETSALQLLASITGDSEPQTDSNVQIPEFTAASSQDVGPHVGTWKVNLPGNQSVALQLDEQGDFSWTATKEGKSSSFQGQYRLEEGRLTLVRESDLQQMTGSWSGQGAKFIFKLDGATTSGLAFQRS